MSGSNFQYVTYIHTTPKKLWRALTEPKIIQEYWFGLRIESDWKVGSTWRFYYDEALMDSGKILQIVPEKRLVRSWRNEWKPSMKAEGLSRCTYEIEQLGSCMKLTVTHSIRKPNSKFIKAVSEGWPMCLANLKSWLEIGHVALEVHPGHED